MVGVMRTLEVSNQSQGQRYAIAIQLLLDILPSCDQNNSLSGIATGSLENGVEVLTGILLASRVIGVVLAANLEPDARQDVLQLVIDPAEFPFSSTSLQHAA